MQKISKLISNSYYHKQTSYAVVYSSINFRICECL